MNMSLELENVYDQQKYGIPEMLWAEFRALVISTVKSMKWSTAQSVHYVRIYCEFTIYGDPAACDSQIGCECDEETTRLVLWRMYSEVAKLLRGRIRGLVDIPESACNITLLKPA